MNVGIIITDTSQGCVDYPSYQQAPLESYPPEKSGWTQQVSFSFLNILQDLDEVFQAKDIAWIWSIVGGVFIPGAFVCCVSKVDHPDVNFDDIAAVGRLQSLLPIIDDEERAGVEPV